MGLNSRFKGLNVVTSDSSTAYPVNLSYHKLPSSIARIFSETVISVSLESHNVRQSIFLWNPWLGLGTVNISR